MKIFLTGASGFIGKRLIDLLNFDSRIEKIYCLCRRNVSLPPKCVLVEGSLEGLADLQPTDADVCIHAAAVTNSLTVTDDDVYKTNVLGTKAVIDYCNKSSVKKIVFISSVNVYLERKYAYALSKLEAEKMIADSGLDYCILRCAFVYGKGCETFEKILNFGKKLGFVPVLGNGKAFEQPIYVDEACGAISECAFSNDRCGIYDLYGKTKMTYNEMVVLFLNSNGIKARLIHLPVSPFAAVSDFCYKRKIPFPLLPEQISHMCEDLCHLGERACIEYGFEDFEINLRKYI